MQIKLSPSSLSLFKCCPLCFWLAKNKGIEHPEGMFSSLPSGMDRILKKHFDSYRVRGMLPPELNRLSGMKLFDDMERLGVWRNNYKGIEYENNKIGATLKGIIDDLLVKDGRFVVLDFKTRGFPVKENTHESYQDQLNIYTYLFEKNGYETEHYAYLLFYHPEKVNEDGSVTFGAELVKVKTYSDEAEKLFYAAVEILRSDSPPKAASECPHCLFVHAREA